MSLIGLVLTLIVVGLLLWLVEKYIPMDATIKLVIRAVVVIAVVLWILNALGALSAISDITIPRVR